jgi:hypothetical protein
MPHDKARGLAYDTQINAEVAMRSLATGAFLLASAIVAGCTTQAQRDAESMNAGIDRVHAELKKCYAAAISDPKTQLYAARRGDLNQPSLEDLTNQSTANEEEKRAIVRYHELIQRCRKITLDGFLEAAPSFVPVYVKLISRSDQIYADLVTEKVTWGEANGRFAEVGAAAETELQEVANRIDANRLAQHESEMASRRAASAAINNMKPVVCSVVGSTVVCY